MLHLPPVLLMPDSSQYLYLVAIAAVDEGLDEDSLEAR